MNSMTGYGAAALTMEGYELSVQIASVNRKNLEVNVYLPRDWLKSEQLVSSLIRETLERGRINVHIQVTPIINASGSDWDESRVINLMNRLKSLAELTEVPYKPDLAVLVSMLKLGTYENTLIDEDFVYLVLEEVTRSALSALVDMRNREGDAIAYDMLNRLELIQKSIQLIQMKSFNRVPTYREQLMARLKQLNLDLNVEDERVLKEVAIFADKADITEEITRVNIHLDAFITLVKSKENRVGRKMDFMCQEIFRELNTLGVKSNNIQIAQVIIEAKNELERIREQVQNIE